MKREPTDYDLLERLMAFTRLEEKPTEQLDAEFSRLKDELEARLKGEISLEKRTCRLIHYLKAA